VDSLSQFGEREETELVATLIAFDRNMLWCFPAKAGPGLDPGVDTGSP
jgi:hypothetical protein